MALWDDKTEALVKESCGRDAMNERKSFQALYDTAVDYIDGDMLTDVDALLSARYPNRQRSDPRARIAPYTLPLVPYYLAELATLYDKAPKRTLVDEQGEPDEDESERLNEALSEIGYDSTLRYVHKAACLLKSAGLYWQVDEDGLPDPIFVPPQDIYPIAPETTHNPANQSAYVGFVLDNRQSVRASTGLVMRRTYTLVKPEGVLEYVASADQPHIVRETISQFANPYKAPLFTIWHHEKPARELLSFAEPPILNANRNLNVQFSVLHDIFRFQAGALPIQVVANPDVHGAMSTPVGVHFMQTLRIEESMQYLQAGNDWGALLKFLVDYANMMLMLSRTGAGGELNMEGRQVASGFAKLIDELPKLEARESAIPQAQRNEKRQWPILRAMLQKAKRMSAKANALTLQVEYASNVVPQSPQERIAELTFEFERGITSPAEYLAEKKGITQEEAKTRIAENLAAMKSMNPQSLFDFGTMIDSGAKEEETKENDDARDTTDRDRRDGEATDEGSGLGPESGGDETKRGAKPRKG